MANVLFGNGWADARGSIAGVTYSRNKAGAYTRNRTKPVNPGSTSQSDVRTRFGSSATAWSILTDTQRAAWNAYALNFTRLNKLGQPYTPTGRQIYLEVAQNLQIVGTPPLSTPSAFTNAPSIDSKPALTADVTPTPAITISDMGAFTVPGGGDGFVILRTTPPIAPTIFNFTKYLRQVSLENSVSIAPIVITTDYEAVFGTPAVGDAGKSIGLTWSIVDGTSGLRSPEASDMITIT